ncbi:MAG: thiamine pyrophosphate-dependent enzyme [Chloroflexota bacterium]|nr:thiamine pyrophosphate-dependent enzyme [Chloroflexota bacterium]
MAKVAIKKTSEIRAEYYRPNSFPTIWCPGCGIGNVVASMVRAIDTVGLKHDDTVVVTGIGCSGIIYNYLNFDAYHGIHGRAIPVAVGLKLANPRLNVIVPMGDGDSSAIGGNHLIHAARRNIDITAIVVNNSTYGNTGGQFSPLTPTGSITTTSPFGNIENSFDLCELAKGAGATYVARGATYYSRQMIDLIANGIRHKGFSLIEVISQCPVQYGRRNKLPTAVDLLKWQKENTVSVTRAKTMSPEELKGKFIIGELVNIEAPDQEYTARYERLIEKARSGGKS